MYAAYLKFAYLKFVCYEYVRNNKLSSRLGLVRIRAAGNELFLPLVYSGNI